MSGEAVIRALLANNSAVTAIVPASRIRQGVVPLNTVLPAISVTQISSTPRNHIKINEVGKMHTDRIQVTAIFSEPATSSTTGYPGMKALLKLVLAACPSQRGTVASVSVDSIIPQGEGPPFYNEQTKVHACSRDFLVRYTE